MIKNLHVMIDLKKAFDTVYYERLLLKLNNYGIRGNAYDLLKSYLTNRYQYVRINNNSSTLKQIKYGVPQGFILGPLFYIIYCTLMIFQMRLTVILNYTQMALV